MFNLQDQVGFLDAWLGCNVPGALSTPDNEGETSFSDIIYYPLKFKELLIFFSAVCLSF